MEKIDYPYDTSTIFNPPLSTEDSPNEQINDLLIVDYRYARFALDPRTGLFSMVRSVLFTSSEGIDAHPSVPATGGIHPGMVWPPYRMG